MNDIVINQKSHYLIWSLIWDALENDFSMIFDSEKRKIQNPWKKRSNYYKLTISTFGQFLIQI